MSSAFRKHDFNLNDFDRCPHHGCVVMRVAETAQPVCFVEWLVEKAEEREVRDVILRGRGKYELPAVILNNGFMLPVRRAVDVAAGNPDREVNESLIGWRVGDVLYMRGEHREGVGVELLPPGAVVDEDPGVLLHLDIQILLYLLFDEEIRKVEP